MKNYVEADWLREHLDEKNLKVVDCQFKLGAPEEGKQQYEQSHIPGAVYFDLEKDLSGEVREHGGRHPLPDLHLLKDKLEANGISKDTIIVVYDGKEGAFASRFWWLLKYMGHEEVYILNGGFALWEQKGYPTDQTVPKYAKTTYIVTKAKDMLASYEEIKDIALNGSGNAVLIDSRESRRYKGIEEPIDRIAGHIPTAINKPWMESLENGSFKSRDQQEKRFAELDRNQPVIVYCGSGVTATPNYIALKEAGFKHVKLYAGSYSDWVSYKENPVSKYDII